MVEDDEREIILAATEALNDMRSEEHRSAELLKQLLGGEYKPRDVDGAQSTHDLDLRLDDGRVFAVEVTTDPSAVDRAFWDQIDRINPLRCLDLLGFGPLIS